jgi:hypothetical protein
MRSKVTLKNREEAKLEQFNKVMGAKIRALKFTKNDQIDTNQIDEDFAAVAKIDYMK